MFRRTHPLRPGTLAPIVVPLLAAAAVGTDSLGPNSRPPEQTATIARSVDLASTFTGVAEIATVRTPSATYVALEGITDSGGRSIEVSRISTSGEATSLPGDPAPSEGLFVARRGDEPCIGTNARGTPHVVCFNGREWVELTFAGLDRTATLTSLANTDAGPAALLVRGDGARARHSVLRWTGLEWRQVGEALSVPPGSVAILGEHRGSSEPVVGTSPGPSRHGVRRVLVVRGGRWVDLVRPARGRGGPVIDGPLVIGGTAWVAENARGTGTDIRSRFSVLRWRVGGRARRLTVSSGTADAQGTISLVDGHIWAGWRGSRRAGSSLLGYRVTTNVARIDATGSRVLFRRNLWSGPLGFPLPVRVADVNGTPHATYVRATSLTGNPTPVVQSVVAP